ncbi:MAG: N-6 DNA methylase [Candidatus Riflebacteria bacterium]|nr:N-6 DNA methylase [Candidatus Riflebacteria bacterium]
MTTATDTAIRDHKAWIGYVQPDGLVVSPAALVDARAILDTRAIETQERFLDFVDDVEVQGVERAAVNDFRALVEEFLEWPADCIWGFDPERPIPEELRVGLPEGGGLLEPSFAFRLPDPAKPWLLLGQVLPLATDLDAAVTDEASTWSASPTRRLERLLLETGVPIGLLANGLAIRLLYAPRGESSGNITFQVSDMRAVAGRPILAAFHLLLEKARLLTVPTASRLPALLSRSREYQATVSTALAGQVLDALYELLRGFQAADEHEKGKLLGEVLDRSPDDIYAGLLTVLMRLVFLLYAEDRGLMPSGPLYARNYSVHGLFARLRSDHEHHPDTMDSRYGAWAQLVTVFRIVHGGCRHPRMRMPDRRGHLFDPDRFPFVEGRTLATPRFPLVADGVIHGVLEKLLVLDGEALSYRTLDVEQIGSVYETMMGFKLRVAGGRSIAIKPAKPHGAPIPIDLDELLIIKATERARWFKQRTGRDLTDRMLEELRAATTIDGILAALRPRIADTATPEPVAKGAMLLVPSDERRRSGSHYTPRSFTEPIVRKALEPVLLRLGEKPTPERILDLKVCDPAVGSGAFLVEACRQLGDALVTAWHDHRAAPAIPPDEDETLHARRLVAQRCLYGVDKNPMAADLAKLSLWLVTLARDHRFTFIDHAIRHGDSLVGLTCAQIEAFDWDPGSQATVFAAPLKGFVHEAAQRRLELEMEGDLDDDSAHRALLADAQEAVKRVRFLGDAVVAAFFSGKDPKERSRLRDTFAPMAREFFSVGKGGDEIHRSIRELAEADRPVAPFHWEVEFPEVFARADPGFDAIVGNPPFLGGRRTGTFLGDRYRDWLSTTFPNSNNNADLVAFFFRRAFELLKHDATLGMLATKSIYQGDTRDAGLRRIREAGGQIYSAVKRRRWPGEATVLVSVIHIIRGAPSGPCDLDGTPTQTITSYLFDKGIEGTPTRLRANAGKSFQGCILLSMGFTFDDTDADGKATPLAEMARLIELDPRNRERIFPYIGGREVNDDPRHAHHRYAIDFFDMSLDEAASWPELFSIVRQKVKPDRDRQKREALRSRWWQYADKRPALRQAIHGKSRVLLTNAQAATHLTFAFLSADAIFANSLNVFPLTTYREFALLQSRVHEVWAYFFCSSLGDGIRYNPTDCFDTFAFPPRGVAEWSLEQAGREYYEHRAALMVENDEGLTRTYNRFHDPRETAPGILKLRALHDAMDRAVLDAYGWTDFESEPDCLLDHEEEEEEEDSGELVNARPRSVARTTGSAPG